MSQVRTPTAVHVVIATLYVTHDQEEALSVSDRVAVMHNGRIEQIGPPAEIYGDSKTPFVAEFIGTINRVPATIVDGEDGTVAVDGTAVALPAARGLAKGARVLVLVRPETIRFDPDSNGNSIKIAGTVESSIFLGATTRVSVSTPFGELSADLASTEGPFVPGAQVPVAFPARAARVLALED